jgi:hypothetical protein
VGRVPPDREVATSFRAYGTPSAVVIDTMGRSPSPVGQGALSIPQLVGRAAKVGLRRVIVREATETGRSVTPRGAVTTTLEAAPLVPRHEASVWLSVLCERR